MLRFVHTPSPPDVGFADGDAYLDGLPAEVLLVSVSRMMNATTVIRYLMLAGASMAFPNIAGTIARTGRRPATIEI